MTKSMMLSLGLGFLLVAGMPTEVAAAPAPVVKAKPVAKATVKPKAVIKPVVAKTVTAKPKVALSSAKTVTTKSAAKAVVKPAKAQVNAKPAVVKTASKTAAKTTAVKATKASTKTTSTKVAAVKKVSASKAVAQKARKKTSETRTAIAKPIARNRFLSQTVKTLPQAPLALRLESSAALVIEQSKLLGGQALYEKNSRFVTPIASVTKLMTAMVILDARLPMDELLTIAQEDVDLIKKSASRLKVGTVLSREEMLRLALMSSENRAAHALGRTYPGGERAFVTAMNFKAAVLGMRNARFYDPTGLSSTNVATAEDLARMVSAAYRYPEIRRFSTTESKEVEILDHRILQFRNTNPLVKSPVWDIGLSKTGFIKEAGHCLVMQATIGGRDLIIVLLDSAGKYSRVGDSNRIKQWLERDG